MSVNIIEKVLHDHVQVVNHYDGVLHCRCGWKSTMLSPKEVQRAERRYRSFQDKDGCYHPVDFLLQPVEASTEHRRHIALKVAAALEA